MGDLAHLMPVIHPYVVAAEGHAHAADWRINEPQHGYLTPAKLLAMTAIDLLYGDAAAGAGNPRPVRAGDDQGGLPGAPARFVQKRTLCRSTNVIGTCNIILPIVLRGYIPKV